MILEPLSAWWPFQVVGEVLHDAHHDHEEEVHADHVRGEREHEDSEPRQRDVGSPARHPLTRCSATCAKRTTGGILLLGLRVLGDVADDDQRRPGVIYPRRTGCRVTLRSEPPSAMAVR